MHGAREGDLGRTDDLLNSSQGGIPLSVYQVTFLASFPQARRAGSTAWRLNGVTLSLWTDQAPTQLNVHQTKPGYVV